MLHKKRSPRNVCIKTPMLTLLLAGFLMSFQVLPVVRPVHKDKASSVKKALGSPQMVSKIKKEGYFIFNDSLLWINDYPYAVFQIDQHNFKVVEGDTVLAYTGKKQSIKNKDDLFNRITSKLRITNNFMVIDHGNISF